MLLISDFLTVADFEKIKICSLCHGKPGLLFKFVSHNGKRTDYICSNCKKQLGGPRVQQMLEDMPLPITQKEKLLKNLSAGVLQ